MMIVMKMKMEFPELTPVGARVRKVFERVAKTTEELRKGEASGASKLETMRLGELLYYALLGEGTMS